MQDSKPDLPIRVNIPEWITILSGDNDVEIMECKIRVQDFAEAVEVATKIAPLVMQYEPLDSEYVLRLNVVRWGVEASITVPTGYWESEAQKKLAEGIAEIKRQATA